MIEIINQTKHQLDFNKINRLCLCLFENFVIPQKNILEILFVSPKTIKSLNKSYRQMNKTTDVLSFASPRIPGKENQVFGSIVICPDYIIKTEKNDDYLPYIIHGFIHLNGHDHNTDQEYHNFAILAKNICQKIK